MQKRFLVYLQRKCENNIPRKAQFTESVVDAFNNDKSNVHCAEVFLKHEKDKVILLDDCLESQKLSLVRPSLCPIHRLTPDIIDLLPSDTQQRGIDYGCSIILESCDGYVLLTRRASHLRTFPGVWTPPGGHVEENEALLEAGLREFAEETGLTIREEDCENNRIPVLGLWESTYPPMLTLGLPIRHHIVVYLHAKMKEPFCVDRLQSELKLDPEEVGASVWLDRQIVRAVSSTFEGFCNDEPSVISRIPENVSVTVTSRDGHQCSETMLTRAFFTSAPLTGPDVERISAGTQFALGEWLKLVTM